MHALFLFDFCGAEDQTQGLMHVRQIFYHRVTSLCLNEFLSEFFDLSASVSYSLERMVTSTTIELE
jgi:hypothetical protein